MFLRVYRRYLFVVGEGQRIRPQCTRVREQIWVRTCTRDECIYLPARLLPYLRSGTFEMGSEIALVLWEVRRH